MVHIHPRTTSRRVWLSLTSGGAGRLTAITSH
ncbi:hypothetical protein Hamer_G007756 [Homarus americanus]|uniref:Uncharacterized protein n=1 Tax=Homarus americanus TaxID=6706 RepID=A0A8J5MR86_HOMAM|nr:hypothetical protein Hamer_G007756 [Homarus americanus]